MCGSMREWDRECANEGEMMSDYILEIKAIKPMPNYLSYVLRHTQQAPKSASKLTVSILEEFLQERYGAHLQSVSEIGRAHV